MIYSIEGKIVISQKSAVFCLHFASILLSLFTFFSRFGLARSKRDLTEKPEGICPTRTHFIHPRVAFSVKGLFTYLQCQLFVYIFFKIFFSGQWLFIVNLPGRSDQQQGIVTEECT